MITLRPATMDDRDILLAWRNDLNIMRWQGYTGEVTLAEHEAWLARWIVKMEVKQQSSYDERLWEGLFMAEDSEIGLVGTGRITQDIHGPLRCDCHVHYMVAPELRKQGWGYKLVRALVDHAKDKMLYKTIGAKIHRANTASLKCALMGGVNAVELL